MSGPRLIRLGRVSDSTCGQFIKQELIDGPKIPDPDDADAWCYLSDPRETQPIG
jgi:hypothetical protein